jgi:general secretion pathway protein D
MNTLLAAGIVALLTQGSNTDQSAPRPISLNFSQTDVSQIFRAIGMRTGANIIYSGADKLPVTLHFNAENADEAIRGTTAAAGLAYRRVGRIYVVAKPEALRQALAPFAERARIKTEAATPELAKSLQDLIPNATITAGIGEIQVYGIAEDIKLAQELISDRIAHNGKDPRKVEVLTLGYSPASKVAEIIGNLYPDIKATAIADAQFGGGTLALIGNERDVAAARSKALELDIAPAISEADTLVIETYQVRYSSANLLRDFLGDARLGRQLEVSVPPPTYIPSEILSSNGANSTARNGGNGTSVPQLGGGSGGGAGSGGSGGTGGGGGDNGGGGGRGAANTGEGQNNRESENIKWQSTHLVLKGPRSLVNLALDLLKKVDIPPQQVVVEVRIVDASPTDIEKYGLKYNWDSFQFSDATRGTAVPGNLDILRAPGVGMISRTPLNFLATLDLMVAKTDAKLMANPSIQVLNNQNAVFFVGDQLSFPVTTSGALGQTNVEIKDYQVGISLSVNPRVNADGNITMRLLPMVQTLTGIVNGLPQTASRTADTVVMVKDGETVVLGGLIRDEDTRTVTEVPLLSKLPIVGQLFRHTDRNHRRSNIIVTVTPHLVPMAPVSKK